MAHDSEIRLWSIVIIIFLSILAGEDYVDPGDIVLQFVAGDSRICIQIEILNDNDLESVECFYVDLVPTIQGIENSTTKVQINDDEGRK